MERRFRLAQLVAAGDDLKDPDANLVHCDRQLFAKLKTLNQDELLEKTKHYLTEDEVKALMIDGTRSWSSSRN